LQFGSENQLNGRIHFSTIFIIFPCVEFVFFPQHETSCDPETTTKEDADH